MYIEFLGFGNSHSKELGESSALFQNEKKEPLLLIDIGSNTYHILKERNIDVKAIFITHLHFDHIGGLEKLFYEKIFLKEEKIKIFCHYNLISGLCKKMFYSGQIAENGVNFFDCFQLIPVDESFWLYDFEFKVFENRHHAPKSSYGLSLPGKFLYSGDTRPIPEIMGFYANSGEIIFHDCCQKSNPSHSSIDDILREYDQRYIDRMYFYHLNNLEFKKSLNERGFNTVNFNKLYKL